jgi:hypothetical protein
MQQSCPQLKRFRFELFGSNELAFGSDPAVPVMVFQVCDDDDDSIDIHAPWCLHPPSAERLLPLSALSVNKRNTVVESYTLNQINIDYLFESTQQDAVEPQPRQVVVAVVEPQPGQAIQPQPAQVVELQPEQL